jgi:hypothetical protein
MPTAARSSRPTSDPASEAGPAGATVRTTADRRDEAPDSFLLHAQDEETVRPEHGDLSTVERHTGQQVGAADGNVHLDLSRGGG